MNALSGRPKRHQMSLASLHLLLTLVFRDHKGHTTLKHSLIKETALYYNQAELFNPVDMLAGYRSGAQISLKTSKTKYHVVEQRTSCYRSVFITLALSLSMD